MARYIELDAVLAEIERLRKIQPTDEFQPKEQNKIDWIAGKEFAIITLQVFLDTLEVKEVGVDLGDPKGDKSAKYIIDTKTLEAKEVGVWKTVDNINPPQADRNKIYCVFTKDRYILATVINHPKDDELLQWKCTEFPFHRYDMCEGDKYMQIV